MLYNMKIPNEFSQRGKDLVDLVSTKGQKVN